MYVTWSRCLHASFICCRNTPPGVALVRKLIAVVESIEKLPVYSYDTQSSGYGLQVAWTRPARTFIVHVLWTDNIIDSF